MHQFIKHIKCLNVQLKCLMFAPICFGPSEDGLYGPKHVGTNMRYFNSTF